MVRYTFLSVFSFSLIAKVNAPCMAFHTLLTANVVLFMPWLYVWVTSPQRYVKAA